MIPKLLKVFLPDTQQQIKHIEYTIKKLLSFVIEESIDVAFDESNYFYPMQAHNDEGANVDSWKSNSLPNNEAPQEIMK